MPRIQRTRHQKISLPLHHQLLQKQTRWCHHDNLLLPQRCSQQNQSHHTCTGRQNHELTQSTQTQLVSCRTSQSRPQWWRSICQKNCRIEHPKSLWNRSQWCRNQQPSHPSLNTSHQIIQRPSTRQCHCLPWGNKYLIRKNPHKSRSTIVKSSPRSNKRMHGMGSSLYPWFPLKIQPKRLKIGINVSKW